MNPHATGPKTTRATRWMQPIADEPHFGLYVYEDPDAFLGERETRAPYFASLWPAGISLAAEIFLAERISTSWDALHVLDLGCGLGVAGLAAATRQADVMLVDYEVECLDMVRASAARLNVDVSAQAFDWRRVCSLAPMNVILAADVLYDVANHPFVARTLKQGLAKDGRAWIADPMRPHAPEFIAQLPEFGLTCRKQWRSTIATHDVRVKMYEVEHAPASGECPS